METTTAQTLIESLITSRYKKALQASIDNTNTEVVNYNFKSLDNVFYDTYTNKEVKNLNWFTILVMLNRFFYTDPETKVTYISNVTVDKSETFSFYNDKKKYVILWKEEHSFDELEKMTYENKSVNRKIILVWILDWKITKIEAQVTSERVVLSYLKNHENENTVDVSWIERKYKDDVVASILFLDKSKKQVTFTQDEENQHFQDLDSHINSINKSLSPTNGSVAYEPKRNIVNEIQNNLSQEELQSTLSASKIQEDEVIEEKTEISEEIPTQETYTVPTENIQPSFDFTESLAWEHSIS